MSRSPTALRLKSGISGSSARRRHSFPNDIEAVWEIAEHRFVFIEEEPERAGTARHLLFVDDLDGQVAAIAERGLDPATRETLPNGVRKVAYRDGDGNEIEFGGAPLMAHS